jgi:hypothetical protein
MSFFLGPVLLLLGFELRFLPYHSLLVTTVQQVMLVLDMVVLALLWPKITRTRVRQGRAFQTPGWSVAAAVLLGAMSILVAQLPSSRLVVANLRLVEPDEDKLSKLVVTLSLRGRDLSHGDFRNTDLRKADLSEANLGHAVLSGARLDEAYLRFADLSSAEMEGASLRGTDLSGANLEDVRNLIPAQLSQACGTDAKLPPDLTLEPCPSQ